jgi:hypothetical protein
LQEVVNVVGVQSTDVSPQPAAYLTFVGKDVTRHPVMSGRIVQRCYPYRTYRPLLQ